MRKEIVDGTTVYTDLFTDGAFTWNLLVRSGGSVSLYATTPGVYAHQVIFDTLDSLTPNDTARRVIGLLAELSGVSEAVKVLVAAVNGGPLYTRHVVYEGEVDVRQTATCSECGTNHLTGLLVTDKSAANVHNILRNLEVLNGRQVRVTIEWERDSQ